MKWICVVLVFSLTLSEGNVFENTDNVLPQQITVSNENNQTTSTEPTIITIPDYPIPPTNYRTYETHTFINGADPPCRCTSLVLQEFHRLRLLRNQLAYPSDIIWLQISLGKMAHGDFNETMFSTLTEKQRINRFPGIVTEVNAKHGIAKNFQELQQKYGKEDWDFHPLTFILPEQYDDFLAYRKTEDGSKFNWVYKPKYGGAGSGIEIYGKDDEVPNDSKYIIQRYIHNPLLIDKRKFTIRLYVVVTSFTPLRVYLHKDGIVKFTVTEFTNDFSRADIQKHIINQEDYKGIKDPEGMGTDPNVDNVGNRWSVRALHEYFNKTSVDFNTVWERIERTVAKKFISIIPKINKKMDDLKMNPKNCFQLMGLDVDIDEDYKVWYIEANVNPTLGSRAAFDFRDRKLTITQLFDLIGVKEEYPVFQSRISNITQSIVSPFILNNKDSFTRFDPITDDDLYELAKSEHEDKHKGGYIRVFPNTKYNDDYMKYVEEPYKRKVELVATYLKLREADKQQQEQQQQQQEAPQHQEEQKQE
eukprot:TRINITY_DN12111_c0_g1_i1.p1 TRINITY_DN12111_c0_g1~~TRINITY_DN12111_c0_g1_i1.p1  ORF type:complete len:532 (+),score=144.49 TRINITY_DN12111_c0_g1_i1:1581-3176(+)